MRETEDRSVAPNGKLQAPERDVGRERKAVEARCEAHRRWIGEDDEVACRGID